MKKLLISIITILTLLLSTLVYSRFIGTIGLITNEIPLTTNNIKNSYNGLKIVHFSDIHYKKIITNKRVKQLINEINKIKPDIVLFTGDLLDKHYDLNNKDINFLIKELSKINSTYGNYAIIGDNDKEIDELKNIYIQSNFILLNNEETIIYNSNNDKLSLIGINSLSYNKENIKKLLEKTDKDSYKIILIHEPDYIKDFTNKNIDLILSGHSINGSINIPLIKNVLLPKGAKNYYNPHYIINNTNIYISNGIGVNNINFRLFNHPSINFYRIKTNN
ncbi:MAG: metallophosphoesterase [Bacilli bacterium]|nr:metallophosphoesterase [Bacilli bacterium]